MEKVINCIDPENNGSSEIGDFVKCVECEKTMITDIGLEHCPLCGEFDKLMWVNDDYREITIKELIKMGYEVIPEIEIRIK